VGIAEDYPLPARDRKPAARVVVAPAVIL
jgi:hypothetical protein